jgi:hypothetical protein
MRPLRYSINVTLDGCCDHRMIPRTRSCTAFAGTPDGADALLLGLVA